MDGPGMEHRRSVGPGVLESVAKVGDLGLETRDGARCSCGDKSGKWYPRPAAGGNPPGCGSEEHVVGVLLVVKSCKRGR